MIRFVQLLRNRAVQLICVFTIALITVGASDTTAKVSSIGHKMICVCSCRQILPECNHVGCPNSDSMMRELNTQVSAGGSDTSILNWFIAKYGPTVLAAPIRGGFDNAAWIVPIAVFLLAMGGTALLIRKWKGRHMIAVAGAPSMPYVSAYGNDDLRERIRRETEF